MESDLAAVRRLVDEVGETLPKRVEWPGDNIHPVAPAIDFNPSRQADAAQDLPLWLNLKESEAPRTLCAVSCFHRIAHQALEFEEIEMQPQAGVYEAVIPGSSIDVAWDLILFFELHFSDGTATRWPDWRTGTPYLVIPTR